MRGLAALGLSLLLLAGGCGWAATREPASVTQSRVFTWRLPPGRLVEVELELGPGAEARARFAAEGGVLDWDVHSHPVAGLQVFARGRGAIGDIPFRPPAPGRYFYLWQNPGLADFVALRVELTLTGDARVVHPPPPGAELLSREVGRPGRSRYHTTEGRHE